MIRIPNISILWLAHLAVFLPHQRTRLASALADLRLTGYAPHAQAYGGIGVDVAGSSITNVFVSNSTFVRNYALCAIEKVRACGYA